MWIFSHKQVGTGDTSCYTVFDSDRTAVGQVRKDKHLRRWIAEDAEGSMDFLKRDNAAFWLVERQALRVPRVERALAFDPTPAGLVPAPLRKNAKSLWARLRKEHFKDGNMSCAVCKTIVAKKEVIDGHEVYSFPSPSTIRLDKILFVCHLCHYAIHFDRTGKFCSKEYTKEVQKHYIKVNGNISQKEFESDFKKSIIKSLLIRDFYKEAKAPIMLDFGRYQSHVDALVEKRRLRSEWLADDDDSGFEMYPDHECPWYIGHAN